MDLINIIDDKIPVIVNNGSIPKMVIVCNELPEINDQAIAKRLQIIKLGKKEA